MVLPPRGLLRLVPLAALLGLFGGGPASADSFGFSYSSGYGQRHGHGHRHHHYGPHYRYGYYAYPPAYYPAPSYYYPPPPPRVVYVPAPLVVPAMPASPVYRAPNGQYCREYQSTVIVGGRPQPGYGTACLQPDGSWRVVD
jgi:hypothetical protein